MAFAAILAATLLVPMTRPSAHEGHDHGPPQAATGPAAPRITVHSETYELVGILKGDQLVIYLDRFASNEPVTAATVAVTIGDAADAVHAEPKPDGTYVLTLPRLRTAGSVELVFSITAENGDDLLIGTLVVPQAAGGVSALSGSASSPWRAWLTSALSQTQQTIVLGLATLGFGLCGAYLLRKRRFLPGAATALAAIGALALLVGTARGHEDHDHTKDKPAAGSTTVFDSPRRLPDGSVFMPKPTQRLLEVRTEQLASDTARRAVHLIGRVIADPNRTSLVQSINGGRVIAPEAGLARMGQAVKKGDLLAQIEPSFPLADRTTIAERVGEVEQLIAVAELRLRRAKLLVEKQVVAQSQLIDAEIELDGLRRRREALHATRAEPEALRAQTSGVIAAARVVPGQVVQAQDIVFQIVDPGAVWIEALVYGDIDPAALTEATAMTPGGQKLMLRFQGFSPALRQHATAAQFAVENPPKNLGIGRPVTVIATTGEPVTALIVPRDAVVRSANGEAIVWRHVAPERFEPRPVRTTPLDASRLILASGVAEGDRIVVRAADLVNQVR